MMKLKDLKIGTQMKMGFSVIIILIVGLGAIAWQQTDKIAQHTLDMYYHPFTVRKALGSLNADVLSIQVEFRNLLLAHNDSGRQAALVNSKVHEADAIRQFEILSERFLGPPSDVVEARESFIRWSELWDGNKELVIAGKVQEAYARLDNLGDIGREREHLLKYIHKIDVFAGNKGTEFYSNTTILKDTLNRQLGVMLIIVLFLTVFIVYLLNKSIIIPISELSSVTKQFRDGNFKIRSSYQSRNEFGNLSTSFNNLAETIETELVLNDQSANLAGIMLREDDAHTFCHALLNSLLDYTDAQIGAFYLLNDQKTAFEHFESVGMEIKDLHSFSTTHLDGEFGRALTTRKIQHITDIPADATFNFSTVSGIFKPREIMTIPIVNGHEVLAVISLATIKRFNENHLRLVNSILSTLSARIDGILAYQKAVVFAQQLEYQNGELEMQKKELSMQTNELTGQNIELEIQKKQLGEANKMKTSFLSNMSHELRTPLNSVIALSGVLNRRLKGKVPEEEHSFLDVIERNGKQLLRLINDILDLSRIESGYEEVEIKQLNVNNLVKSVVEMIEPQATEKGIYLQYIAKENIPDINSDYFKCYHILQNLLANAIKFTDTGGVEIKLELKDKAVNIIVNDTGIGIDKDHITHIFDEFRQADSSNSRKYGGTGLGLAIAQKYANLLGGSIKVDSTIGKGSTFTLILPIENNSVETYADKVIEKPITLATDQLHLKEQAKDKTILLVEDTEAIIIQMNDMLTTQGYKILIARNGEEALQQIQNKVPDAMILDLMMPGVDGFEVLTRVRGEVKAERLPIIILTAKYVTKQEFAFLQSNGIVQLIQKGDIDKDQLLQAVNRMMDLEVKELEVPVKKQPKNIESGTQKVMVVEDNADNMLTIRVLLKDKYQIIEAQDGLLVAELALKHRPHLILMDIALPGKNGIEALADLRKVEMLRAIPVIAISASAMTGAREEFLAYGFDDYISKPIDSDVFEKTIEQYLN